MSLRLADANESGALRARVAKLRQELAAATQAYRAAVAKHDSQNAIPLLRSRSRLMRQLLDTQCELLLRLKSDAANPDLAPPPGVRSVSEDRVLV